MKLWLTPIAAEDIAYWRTNDPHLARKTEQALQALAQAAPRSRHLVTPLAIPKLTLLSVKISSAHRLVFEQLGDDIIVHQCRYHY